MVRLEEEIFFQERLLQDLNAALTAQQYQMDSMQGELEALREKVLELGALLDASGGVNTAPPHYNQG